MYYEIHMLGEISHFCFAYTFFLSIVNNTFSACLYKQDFVSLDFVFYDVGLML